MLFLSRNKGLSACEGYGASRFVKRTDVCWFQSKSNLPAFRKIQYAVHGRGSSVGIATRYGLDGPGIGRSQWPSGPRRGSAADRLLGLRIWIPPGAWMFVLCVLYSQDKESKSQDNQDKKVRIKCKERTKKIDCAGEIFCTRLDRTWCLTSLLYNGYRFFFPGVKRPGRGVNHPPP